MAQSPVCKRYDVSVIGQALHQPAAWIGRDGKDLSACNALAMDFDGVMTDDGVWLSPTGVEHVRVYRRDGLGISRVRQSGIACAVFSGDSSPVISTRCDKLEIESFLGVEDKLMALTGWLDKRGLSLAECAYLGNDINDFMSLAACNWAVVTSDCDPSILSASTNQLIRPGGHGAVREFCDALLAAQDLRVSGATSRDRRGI